MMWRVAEITQVSLTIDSSMVEISNRAEKLLYKKSYSGQYSARASCFYDGVTVFNEPVHFSQGRIAPDSPMARPTFRKM